MQTPNELYVLIDDPPTYNAVELVTAARLAKNRRCASLRT
jgi:hypothetical protein